MAKTSGRSMTSIAYEHIRSDILSGRFAADQKIKISDLVRDLGLSLGAVREALSRLGSEGLVVAETNKGYRVVPITAEELADLTNTRILIECECLASAIRNGDLKWEAGIVAAHFELSRVSRHDDSDGLRPNPAWSAAHRAYHGALVAACDSPWLLRIRDMLFVQSERYRSAALIYSGQDRDRAAEHQALADATLARDIPAATAVLRAHLLTTRHILEEAGIARLCRP